MKMFFEFIDILCEDGYMPEATPYKILQASNYGCTANYPITVNPILVCEKIQGVPLIPP